MSESSPKSKFGVLNGVRHLKSGGEYIILKAPDKDRRLEHCDEPFYEYTSVMTVDERVWIRRKSEMEDGRFERITSV